MGKLADAVRLALRTRDIEDAKLDREHRHQPTDRADIEALAALHAELASGSFVLTPDAETLSFQRFDPLREGFSACQAVCDANTARHAHAVLMPMLREAWDDRWRLWQPVEGYDETASDLMFGLKVMAMYPDEALVQRVLRAYDRWPDEYLWSVVHSVLGRHDSLVDDLLGALEGHIPEAFAGVALLDLCNQRALAGAIVHPFDGPLGRHRLKTYLSDADNHSYAVSATAALPFLSEASALLAIAEAHDDTSVRLEAAWARARRGDHRGVHTLASYAATVQHHHLAAQYLKELGHAEAIPTETQTPAFAARAELASWLAHPNEYGEAPTSVEVVDHRTLVWPPDGEARPVWLLRYHYAEREPPEAGLGMVGSVTFALFGEATDGMDPLDAYGLHCCWQLQFQHGRDIERTAANGRALLRKANPGMGF